MVYFCPQISHANGSRLVVNGRKNLFVKNLKLYVRGLAKGKQELANILKKIKVDVAVKAETEENVQGDQ